MNHRIRTHLAALLSLASLTAQSAPPPLEAFARLPQIRGASISPNGQRIAFIGSYLQNWDDREVLLTFDSSGDAQARIVLSSDPGKFDLSWCNWANDERLLCGVTAVADELGVSYAVSRLVAINADGQQMKVLIYKSRTGGSQFQDRVLDWTPDDPKTVLVELDPDRDGYPAVYELDIYDGMLRLRTSQRPPIRSFATDSRGAVRLGHGYFERRVEWEYFARLDDDKDWRRLAKIRAFSTSDELRPLAVVPRTNRAYAHAPHEGRDALFEMDLTDEREPVLIFSHPLVDAATPHFTSDGRLLGVYYETDRPFIYYTDARARAVMNSLTQLEPTKFHAIVAMSHGQNRLLIRSTSDIDAGTYHMLDVQQHRLLTIATAYPELAKEELGRMRSITYEAADGTEIPGYLTTPPGLRAERLPLIIMPHGGPVHRDTWEFDFLRHFLASRGYAVLQMNFRGSSGYGSKWFYAAHQDWGGLTYSDITDAARWAVKKGIADPQRMCIVGWSFGGYAALLGAVRNPDLYRCSASIAGVSDLHHLLVQERRYQGAQFAREQIGTNSEKLKLDSPLRHAKEVMIPVLLVHGDDDLQVDVDQSRRMAKALKRERKAHRFIELEKADHSLWRKSDRIALLTELDAFLREHLGPGVGTSE